MSEYNYITDRRLIGGMINSIGMAQQDLIAIKYIFENMDNGLKYISFEGDDDFTLYYSDGHSQKCQCKVNLLTMKYVATLCEEYDDNNKQTIIGSGMNDEFRNFYQKLIRYRNARIEGINQQELDNDWKELCIQKKIDVKKIQNFDFDSVDSINAINLAKCAIIDYGNRNHIYINEDELITKLSGKISIDLRPHSSSLAYDQISELVIKNRVKKSIGVFDSDPIISDYVKIKIVSELLQMESKHTWYREQLSVIRNSIELNQYDQAKNEVIYIMEEEDWISPIYCWLLNRLNDVREMETFVCNYNGNNPQISFEISKYYYLNGEYDKALEILKGFQKESETPELFMLYALIYANIQENNDAIKSAEKCIELDDSFADAYILLASLTKREDAKKAVSFLRKAKDLDAENPNIYYELSAISEFNDDFLLSAKYLKDYINLSGDEDIRVLIKLTVFLNYANDKKWEVEYFDVVRRIQNKSKIENITIPIIIVPKHMELGAFYCFHCDGDKCCLEKNGNIISDVIDLKFIFGIGTYTSPTNNWLIKFDNNTFSNPARLVDESIDSSALSPAIFCFPKSYEAYNKILQELLATETFVVNHNYSENSKEYHDSKRLINLKIEEKNRNVYGVLKIMDKLKYSFTIYDVSEGYKGFCDTINKSPFEEAMFIISMNDKIHQNIFVFKTDQIEVKQ